MERLIRDVTSLVQALQDGDRIKYVFFWRHQPRRAGEVDAACFSQWFPSPFEAGGDSYPTAEHWMMAEKARLFGDEATRREILAAPHPRAAKQLGRAVRDFDEAKWNAKRFEIVVNGNLEKFRQSPELGDFLVGTNERVLVEASPVDRIWGIGLAADHADAERPDAWPGLNLLGFALMEVRDRLRRERA